MASCEADMWTLSPVETAIFLSVVVICCGAGVTIAVVQMWIMGGFNLDGGADR